MGKRKYDFTVPINNSALAEVYGEVEAESRAEAKKLAKQCARKYCLRGAKIDEDSIQVTRR
jgi:hypothetical protein